MELQLLFLLLIFLVALAYGINSFSISEISLIYVTAWVFFSLLVSIFQGYYISPFGYISHILLSLSFFIPSCIFYKVNNQCNNVNIVEIKFKENNFPVFCNIFGFLGLIFHVSQFGFTLNFLELGKLASESRYSGSGVSQWQVLGSSFLFTSCFIIGLRKSKKLAYTSWVTISLILLTSILTSSKASLLISLAFYFSGIVVFSILNKSKISNKLKIKLVSNLIIVFIAVFISAIMLQIIRYGGDLSMLELAFNKITIYAFGQFSAYSVWFDSASLFNVNSIPGYGLFSGLFSKFISQERIAGFYDTFTYISSESYTNVFTLSRFLITDFTILGAMIVLFFLGVLYEVSIRVKGFWNVKILFYSALTIELIFGFSTSILSYNNVIFSLLLIFLYTKNNVKIVSKNCESN